MRILYLSKMVAPHPRCTCWLRDRELSLLRLLSAAARAHMRESSTHGQHAATNERAAAVERERPGPRAVDRPSLQLTTQLTQPSSERAQRLWLRQQVGAARAPRAPLGRAHTCRMPPRAIVPESRTHACTQQRNTRAPAANLSQMSPTSSHLATIKTSNTENF